ncbi:hypothetical protein Ga0061079_1205 [Apibacter mensalis]|uniref:Uncharacterized protein n=1 Tax=Apibacter mensalis TaxID=1586267 RepID=A0A0X3ARU8_9FLAO|nr:hypothetical protein [Apibacter mensalis]CVK17190.1 hypothetical protein Ga0061079_1205 [Apibacter mensalis]
MLKWEICYNPVTIGELISENGVLNKICRLYSIAEDKACHADWTSWFFASPFKKLTSLEVYGAHVMALNGNLLDEEGKMFKIFQVLSIKQSAEILRSYVIEKENNDRVWKAKQILSQLTLTSKTEDKIRQEKEEILRNYCEIIFKELQDIGYTDKATYLYPIIKDKIKISKQLAKRLYRYQAYLFLKKIKNKKDIKESKLFDVGFLKNPSNIEDLKKKIITGIPVEFVKQQCRDIVVSKYLKKFNSYQSLLSELKKLENQ